MARAKGTLINFKKQIEIVREKAASMETEQRLVFETTLERYEVLVNLCDKLRLEVEKGKPIVTKEYVKGRENLVPNPAIGVYNQTVATANKTASTLVSIIKGFSEIKGEEPDDPLLEILNGTVE